MGAQQVDLKSIAGSLKRIELCHINIKLYEVYLKYTQTHSLNIYCMYR